MDVVVGQDANPAQPKGGTPSRPTIPPRKASLRLLRFLQTAPKNLRNLRNLRFPLAGLNSYLS